MSMFYRTSPDPSEPAPRARCSGRQKSRSGVSTVTRQCWPSREDDWWFQSIWFQLWGKSHGKITNTQSAKKWGILPPATCFTDLDRFCSFEHTQINSNITRELPCCYFFILWTKITQVFLYHLKSLVLLAENPNCPSGPSGCYFLGGLGGVYMENFITAAPQRVLLLPAAGTGLLGLMPCKQVLMEYHQVRWKLRWVKQQAWW